MPNDWLEIKVRLLHGGGIELDPPPGRVFVVGPKHTFTELAEAINAAFDGGTSVIFMPLSSQTVAASA